MKNERNRIVNCFSIINNSRNIYNPVYHNTEYKISPVLNHIIHMVTGSYWIQNGYRQR